MWRDVDPREAERERSEDGRGRSGGTQPEFGEVPSDARDAVTRGVDLPRGPRRQRVRTLDRDYRLSGDDVRALATVGAFRVVPANELREPNGRRSTQPSRDLERLQDNGLIKTMPHVVGTRRTTLVTLTERGRGLLESRRTRPTPDGPRQAYYAGIRKPRELAHDARVYAAYQRVAERLSERGARVRRVVLEEELKADYQRFLQRGNRGRRDARGMPERDVEVIARWARENELPHQNGHAQIPDLRIEYEERDGRRAVEDIEVVTPHYRGAHAAAKRASGFTQFRGSGARAGGVSGSRRTGRRIDPRLAEEMLP